MWAPGRDCCMEMSCLGFSVLLFLAFSLLCRIRLPSGCGERPSGSSFAIRPQFPDTHEHHVGTGSFVPLSSVASQVSSTFHHGRELDLLSSCLLDHLLSPCFCLGDCCCPLFRLKLRYFIPFSGCHLNFVFNWPSQSQGWKSASQESHCYQWGRLVTATLRSNTFLSKRQF